MKTRAIRLLSPLALLALTVVPASAHSGHGAISSFAAGITHPFTGLDHMLAMVAVGMLAAQLGGRARFGLPATFVALMLAGAGAALAGLQLPFVETGIAGSVLVLGAVVAFGGRVPLAAAAFAVVHGFAHGQEMPLDAGGLSYAAGFALATAGLHGVGLAIGLGAARFSATRLGAGAVRLIGGAMALAGIGLIAG